MMLRVSVSFKVRGRFPVWVEIGFIDVSIEGHGLRRWAGERNNFWRRGISIGTLRLLRVLDSWVDGIKPPQHSLRTSGIVFHVVQSGGESPFLSRNTFLRGLYELKLL